MRNFRKILVLTALLSTMLFLALFSQSRDDGGGRYPLIPTFYNGRWIKVGEKIMPRLCPWVEITFGFPQLVQIRTRYALDRYYYEECWLDGIDCRQGNKREVVIYGMCD